MRGGKWFLFSSMENNFKMYGRKLQIYYLIIDLKKMKKRVQIQKWQILMAPKSIVKQNGFFFQIFLKWKLIIMNANVSLFKT